MPIGLRPRAVPKTMRLLKACFPLDHITGTIEYTQAHELADQLTALPDRTADQQTYLKKLNELIQEFLDYEEPKETIVGLFQTKRRPRHAHPTKH